MSFIKRIFNVLVSIMSLSKPAVITRSNMFILCSRVRAILFNIGHKRTRNLFDCHGGRMYYAPTSAIRRIELFVSLQIILRRLSTFFPEQVWRRRWGKTIMILCFREQSFSVFVCLYRMTMRSVYLR